MVRISFLVTALAYTVSFILPGKFFCILQDSLQMPPFLGSLSQFPYTCPIMAGMGKYYKL